MIVALAVALGVIMLGAGAARLACSLGEKILVVAIGFWAACVIAGNILSPFHRMGSVVAYSLVLIACCGVGGFALSRWRSCPSPVAVPNALLDFTPASPWLRRAGFALPIVLLLGFLCLNGWIALTISPTNPDSQMYRMARVYFYESQGSLMHFGHGIDGRMIFYPFNGALLLMPVAVGGWPVEALTVVFVLAWLIIGVAVFEFCRRVGCSSFVALWTVFLTLTSPILLAMATSTNDEIFSGSGLLVGVYFFWRYVQTRSMPMLILSGLAAGCSFGSKLQFVYLWPVGILFAAVLVWRVCSRSGWRGLLAILRAGTIWGIPAIFLSVPFLVYSFLSSSHFFDPTLAGMASNAPFNLRFGIQNWGLHSAELLASPFFELFRWMRLDEQITLLAAVNEWFVRMVSPFLSINERFFLPGESAVKGVWGADNVRPTEDTEWIGFLWLAFGFCSVFALYKWRQVPEVLSWLIGGAVLWWLSFCFAVRYFGPMGVQFAYALILCAPALCLLFVRLSSRWARGIQILVIALCIALNLASARALFILNPNRNLLRDEISRRAGRAHLGQELAGFTHVRILPTHFGMPYLEIISSAPSKGYRVVTEPEAIPNGHDDTVELYSFPRWAPLGKEPIKIPESKFGLHLLGEVAPTTEKGTEFIFGRGLKRPGTPTYGVLEADVKIEPQICRIALGGKFWPALDTSLEFKVTFLRKGKVISVHEWATRPQLDESFYGDTVRQTQMKVEVRRKGDPGSTVTNILFPFRIKGPDLWTK